MAFFSELLGRPVADVDGECIGRLEELIASIRGEMPHPAVVALAIKRQGKDFLIPFCILSAPAPVIILFSLITLCGKTKTFK